MGVDAVWVWTQRSVRFVESTQRSVHSMGELAPPNWTYPATRSRAFIARVAFALTTQGGSTRNEHQPRREKGPSMGVSLTKGGNVSLTKEAPGLSAVTIGLGWDVRTTTGTDFDLDGSAIALNETKKVLSDQHFVFFNNLRSPDGSIEHTGDNLTGDGDGDDEAINIDLNGVPPEVVSIIFPVSIYDAEARSQSFGQVRNAFIRVVNRADGTEIARYDLSEDASTETAMVFGELYRNGPEWKFRAIGQGYASGLSGIARDYGVNV